MKRALTDIELTEENLRKQILDTSVDLIMVKDLRSRVRWANRAACEFMGLSLDEMLARGPDDWTSKQGHGERYRAEDAKVFATRAPLIIPEEPAVGTDGRTHWFNTIKTPVFDDRGEPVLLVAISRDITSARAARQVIERLSQCFLRFGPDPLENISSLTALAGELLEADCAVYNHLERGILSAIAQWRVPPDFNPVNPAQGTLCGQVIARADDTPLVACGLTDGPFKDAPAHTYAGIAAKSGDRVHGSLCVYFKRHLLPDETLTKAMAILSAAIAVEEERLRGDRARARLAEDLRQSQKLEAIWRLAGGIAHDFNNTLTAIRGYAEILAATADSDSHREDARQIVKSTDYAASLTRQLLAYGRRQMLVPRVIDLNDILSGTAAMLKRLIGENISLEVSPWPEPAPVWADPGQMEQVLINLALNARDAMPDGGRLVISIGESAEDLPAADGRSTLGDHWVLTVQDEGAGISREILHRIFEPFFTTKEVGKGTGLGLSTVYGIVAQSGGRITCESAPGRGTRFLVRMPKTRRQAAAAPNPSAVTRGSGKVLLVEDDSAIRGVFTRTLKSAGYEVIPAPDAETALELAKQHGPALRAMVTDIVMPGMNGRQLAMRLENELPGLRIIYMSGYTDDAAFRGALRPGTAFLQKPFTSTELCHKLKEVLTP